LGAGRSKISLNSLNSLRAGHSLHSGRSSSSYGSLNALNALNSLRAGGSDVSRWTRPPCRTGRSRIGSFSSRTRESRCASRTGRTCESRGTRGPSWSKIGKAIPHSAAIADLEFACIRFIGKLAREKHERIADRSPVGCGVMSELNPLRHSGALRRHCSIHRR
jgi:hypothetical protein